MIELSLDRDGVSAAISLFDIIANDGASLEGRYTVLHSKHYNRMFILKDIKTHQESASINGRAQSATCMFCKRTVYAWPKLKKKQHSRSGYSLDRNSMDRLDEHAPPCVGRWLLSMLCKWSTRTGTAAEIGGVDVWKKERMTPKSDSYYDRIAPCLVGCFNNLPQPPDSKMALYLEIGLIGISKILWEQQP